MHNIIGMPFIIIMQGMPIAIIEFIASQHSRIMSIDMPSIGIILHIMPSFPISQVILAIMGRIIGIIIGMPMPIMLPIMPFIIGII